MDAANELAHVVQLAGLIGILLSAVFSIAAGDRPIVLAAIAYLAATAGSVAVQMGLQSVPYGVMAIDIAYLSVLVLIAGRWRRRWPLWAIAFQLLAVLTHVAYLVQPVRSVRYLTLLALWSYLVMAAICVGAGMAWQRRRSARKWETYREGQGYVLPHDGRGEERPGVQRAVLDTEQQRQ